MTIVRVMQVTVYEIINMISVRHRFVTTSWSMNMIGFVTITLVIGGATIRIFLGDFNDMLVHMISMRVM